MQSDVRIAHTVYYNSASGKFFRRSNQELLQFPGSFFIAPVPDPDNIDLFCMGDRMEFDDIGGFVKCPGSRDSESVAINPADGFAKRKNAIHQVQVELEDFTRTGVSAMVAVMQQSDKPKLFLELKHAVHD